MGNSPVLGKGIKGAEVIPMMDTSENLDLVEFEIGCSCEELLTPLTRRTRKRPNGMFAIDNGSYSRFRLDAFVSLLEREKKSVELCRFVAVPDVVGSARRTLEVFDRWLAKLHGWPLALVAQDGQHDLPIPWESISAVFIGGTTEFKLSKHAVEIIKAAQALEKWVHVGRVNTPSRFAYFEDLGCDSIDGTGIAQYTGMRNKIKQREKTETLYQDKNENNS